ncbi:MAG: cysteine desulfurase [Firmicutes bacterium]|nr:cysteine desulfurase [Bacillota bacterium]
MQVYLDNSATTRPFDEVTDIVVKYMKEEYGNPSSLHHMGLEAEKAMKTARRQVADAVGVSPEGVYVTSGGTEADNIAIMGIARARARKGKRIITTKIEHPAVLNAFKALEEEGFEAVYVGVDREGRVDMDRMKEAINEETILISCMHVNNESGTTQPIEEIAKIKGDAMLHVDAVQSFGKLEIPTVGVDVISVSGHKIHGPMGTGAVCFTDKVNIKPLLFGGGQEKDIRPGTENLPAIAGFGLACEMISSNLKEAGEEMAKVRDALAKGLTENIDDIVINSPEGACQSVLNVSFMGTRGEVILHSLEQEGIYVSTGSACSSNHGGGSHVLRAMGLNDREVEGAIRFSFGRFNNLDEVDYVVEKTKQAVDRFRSLGSFR